MTHHDTATMAPGNGTCPDCGRRQGSNGHAYRPCGRRVYEYPAGVAFRAWTAEHAAARVFGGKPADYLSTRHSGPTGEWVEVSTADGRTFVGDIPICSAEEVAAHVRQGSL